MAWTILLVASAFEVLFGIVLFHELRDAARLARLALSIAGMVGLCLSSICGDLP
jgi:multidrug transporter EmrE-like cation transporter